MTLTSPEMASLNNIGFLRIDSVLSLIPISKASWYQGVKKGYYPAPIKLSARAAAWKATDIKDLIDRLSNQEICQERQ